MHPKMYVYNNNKHNKQDTHPKMYVNVRIQ